MRLAIIFCSLAMFSGCFQKRQAAHEEGSTGKDSIVGKPIKSSCLSDEWYSKPYSFSLERADDEMAIVETITDYWVNTRYEDFDKSYIEGFERLEEINIVGLGKSWLYELTYSGRLPSMAPKKEIVVVQGGRGVVALLPIDKYYLVKLFASTTDYYVGGVIPSKATGHFVVYSFTEDGGFDLIFDTMSECVCPRGGIPVTNYSLDCYCYRPFELKFSNEDIDDDGQLDLKFSGELLSFCENGEDGVGRNDREPRSTAPIELIFYGKKPLGVYPLWEFRDTTLCEEMKF
ncbi:MAG: hypothetical protein KDC44_17830 [Phaeodactylibacter sp.]|nr:hypothetical protein [Phaeodactylibacter sp.]